MSLQQQLRKLTTGGPGVTHIATETLFEDCAVKLDGLIKYARHKALCETTGYADDGSPSCSCGLSQVLAGLTDTSGAEQ